MSISFSLASLPYFTNSLSSTVLTLIENNFHIYCGPHLGGCLLFLHPVCLCSCNTMQQKPSNRVLLKFSGLIGDKVTLKKLKVLNIDPDMWHEPSRESSMLISDSKVGEWGIFNSKPSKQRVPRCSVLLQSICHKVICCWLINRGFIVRIWSFCSALFMCNPLICGQFWPLTRYAV